MANDAVFLCRKCGLVEEHGRNRRFSNGYEQACKKCRSKHDQSQQERLKALVFDAYGGAICVGCGEDDFVVLSIDHIEGGGNKHRKELKSAGRKFYHWLKNNGWPSGYRVLCLNCQRRAFVGTLNVPAR